MEGFQTQNKRGRPVNVEEIVQGLGGLTDGITDAIILAKPDEAVKVAEAKEITKVVILGLGSVAEAFLSNPALAKLIGINGAAPVAHHM